jgi:RimJ/RimL family protein N-acetyltransferase
MVIPFTTSGVRGRGLRNGMRFRVSIATETGNAGPVGPLSLCDGVVTLRPSRPADVPALLAGRDEQQRRFLGRGDENPRPTFCILAAEEIAGWVDYDRDVEHDWLGRDEVNVGYALFPAYRARGLATRSVQLLMHHLALGGAWNTASLLIDPENLPSLAVANRANFVPTGHVRGQHYFRRAVPPLSYSDGVVEIRRQRPDDLDRHLGAIDDAQIDWLWTPGDRQLWEAMTPERQRAHQLAHLQRSHDSFGEGPLWRFSVDAGDKQYVAYVDCNLASPQVTAGEANISYVSHPSFRRRGLAGRAVVLVLAFLADHTGAREAHLVIDAENEASLGVAHHVGTSDRERFVDSDGRTKVRHVIEIRRPKF